MTIYIVMTAISMVLAKFAVMARGNGYLRDYRLWAVLSAMPFILVTVLRYRVGTDWTYVYEPYLYYIKHGITEFGEQGFNLIYKFFGLFTDDSWWVIAFVGLMTVVFFFLAIYQQSPMIPFSILLFVLCNKYFTALNQIRQMLAMSIFIYSLKYIEKRNWKGYFFWNLLGATIHTSSVMYLPVYFLYGRHATVKRSAWILILSCASYPFINAAFKVLVSLTKYAWYMEDSTYSQNNFYLLGFLVTLFYTVMHIFALSRHPEGDLKLEFWTNMMVLSTVLLLFSTAMTQVLRVSEGLSVVQVLSLPYLLKKEEDDHVWFWMWLMIVGGYTVKLLYDVYINQWYGVIPYQTIFSR